MKHSSIRIFFFPIQITRVIYYISKCHSHESSEGHRLEWCSKIRALQCLWIVADVHHTHTTASLLCPTRTRKGSKKFQQMCQDEKKNWIPHQALHCIVAAIASLHELCIHTVPLHPTPCTSRHFTSRKSQFHTSDTYLHFSSLCYSSFTRTHIIFSIPFVEISTREAERPRRSCMELVGPGEKGRGLILTEAVC